MTAKESKTKDTSARAKNRPERKPLYKRRVLEAKPISGFKLRWVNEFPDAIEAYTEAGYAIVYDTEYDTGDAKVAKAGQVGSPVRVVINKDPNAAVKTAVLMKIPLEWFTEDQAAKQAQLDEKMQNLDPNYRKQAGADYGSWKKH